MDKAAGLRRIVGKRWNPVKIVLFWKAKIIQAIRGFKLRNWLSKRGGRKCAISNIVWQLELYYKSCCKDSNNYKLSCKN